MAYTVIFNLFMFVRLAERLHASPALTSYFSDASRAGWTRLPTSTHWRNTCAPTRRRRWSQSVCVSMAREKDGYKLSLSILSTWLWHPYILDACAQHGCSTVGRCDWLASAILPSGRTACYYLPMHCIRVRQVFDPSSTFLAIPLDAHSSSSTPAHPLQVHSAPQTV